MTLNKTPLVQPYELVWTVNDETTEHLWLDPKQAAIVRYVLTTTGAIHQGTTLNDCLPDCAYRTLPHPGDTRPYPAMREIQAPS